MAQTTEKAFETYMSDSEFQGAAFPILAKQIIDAVRTTDGHVADGAK